MIEIATPGDGLPAIRPTDEVLQVLQAADRLAALRRTGLLDAPSEEALDRLSQAAVRLLGVPVALVTLVGEDRQFFKGCVGLPEPWSTGRETPLSHSFCQHVVASNAPLVITDAREHPVLRDSLAIAELQVVAYLGIPLVTPDGSVLGSFCVIDRVPRDWRPDEVTGVADFARWAAVEVELRLERAELLQAVRAREALAAELRASAGELEHAVQARTAELGDALRRLRASEKDARQLFERAGDGVLVVEPAGGTVLHANPAACDLLGVPRDRLVGSPAPLPDVLAAHGRPVDRNDAVDASVDGDSADGDSADRDSADGNPVDVSVDGDSADGISADGTPVDASVDEDSADGDSIDGNPVDGNPVSADSIDGIARDWDSFDGDPAADSGSGAAGGTARHVVVHRRPDGTEVHLEMTVSPVEHRGRAALLCSLRDATARLRTETALRASEERFRTVVERMAEGLIITDLESRVVYANPRVEDIFGWRPEELLGKVSWEVLVAPEEREGMAARIPRRKEGQQERYEVRARRRDGSACWIEVAAAPFRNADGEVVGTLGAVTDVTERRRIREDLERSLSLLGATLNATTDGILSVDLEGRITGYNAPFLEMWQLQPPAPGTLEGPLLQGAASLVAHPESFISDILALYERPESEVHDEIRFHDGRVLERALRPQRLGDQVVGRVWSFRDVTDRSRAQAALQAQRGYLRAVLDALPNPVWSKDWDGRFTLANQALGDIYGVTADALLGRTDADFNVSPEEVSLYLEGDRAVIRDGTRMVVVEEPITHADGQTRWYHTRKVGLVPPGGGRPEVLGIATDITERQQAQAALQESEAQFRAIFDASAIGTTMLDADERVLRANAAFQRMVGYGDDALRGMHLADLVHPADRTADGEMFRQLVAGAIGHYQREKRLVRADGGVIWVRLTRSLVRRAEGRDPFVIGMVEDVTERRLAEEALAESQRQLLHSQKMEAVGRLAGGIAHDFNNMLMAIGGHAELLRTEPEMPASCRWQADEIRKAADRAAGLTRQLLAFSRKQVMQPRPLSVNAVITDMEDMLRRLIGETITLRTSLAPDIGVVRADPGQLEQVLMNLAVNARDAMPQGGTLAVQTDNVTLDAEYAALHDEVAPGRYVMLAVADTGTGMDADVRQRIFEPFFTTKPQGQGTGLGLSTVYGIVAQSGGHVRVESEPGKGTVFLIYLPREDQPHETPAVAARQAAAGGRETLLLVEDDEVVRELLRMFLLRLGYRVLGAGSGDEALAVAQAHGSPPDLLLTDVVMPGMSGRELARAVRERWPGVAVIYMSGYTDDAIERHGVLDPGSEFIQKPVSPDLLAHRVRAVLDAPR